MSRALEPFEITQGDEPESHFFYYTKKSYSLVDNKKTRGYTSCHFFIFRRYLVLTLLQRL